MQNLIDNIEAGASYQECILSSTPTTLLRRLQNNEVVDSLLDFDVEFVLNRFKELYEKEQAPKGFQSDEDFSLCGYMYLLFTKNIHQEWKTLILNDNRCDLPHLTQLVKIL